MQKTVNRLILILVLTLVLTVPAAAYTVPDATTPGSLTIVMEINGKIISGGKITIYKTGEIDTRARSYIFVPTEAFKDSGVPLSDIESVEAADRLAAYAKEHSITGLSQTIGESGKVRFDNLTPGLYMVVQDAAAEGYEVVKPFQVAVPEMGEDGLNYNPEAFPKMITVSWGGEEDVPGEEDGEKHETDGSKEQETEDEKNNDDDKYLEGDADLKDKDKEKDSKKLPQTGQLKWPVPVLTIIGLVLFALGWYIRNVERRSGYEK